MGGMTWQDFVVFLERKVELAGKELTVGDLIVTALLAVVIFFGCRLLRSLVKKALAKAPMVDEGTANAIATIIYYLSLAIGATWVFQSIADLTSLAVLTGAIGLGVGLGFQDIAKNFISGIIMLLSKTIKPGDVITVDELTGRVEEVGVYSSRMKTVLDATVIVPNSEILNQRFINWTHDRRIRMVEIPIGVHYDSDIDKVIEILYQAAEDLEHIMSDPPVRVLLVNYGDSSVDFHVRVWTDEVMYFTRMVSDYNLHVWRLFKESGVVIPYPQQDVYIKEIPRKE